MRFSLIAALGALPFMVAANPLRMEITIQDDDVSDMAFLRCKDGTSALCLLAGYSSFFDARGKAKDGDCYVKVPGADYYVCTESCNL